MKVLFLARYIYDETITEFTKNKTGFGMMVNDIAKSVSAFDEVFLLTRVITKGKDYKDYCILKHTWGDVFKSFSIKYLFQGIKEVFSTGEIVKDKLKQVYFYIDSGYTKKVLKTLKPDIIHIHGIDVSTKAYIKICDELKIHYIVTLHGLIGRDERVSISKHIRLYEKRFLQESEEKNNPITVISSGIKRKILDYYELKKGQNIRVITNGTNICAQEGINVDVRKKYNILPEDKVIICVGNITKNKNQIQIVDAFKLLGQELQNSTKVLFLGRENTELKQRIEKSDYKEKLICCGFVDRECLPSYYRQADLNIVASIYEGFGLSMIEGFVYGVPTLTFSDLDAVEDIYNEKAMVLVYERSDIALEESITKALNTKWDKEWIKEYSKQFSLEEMAIKYQTIYNNILESWK